MTNEKIINKMEAWTLYPKSNRTTGQKNRVQKQYTIMPSTIEEFTDFLETYAACPPQRGRGITSAIVEFSIRMTMAIVSGFKVKRSANELAKIVESKEARKLIANNLREIAELLEKE